MEQFLFILYILISIKLNNYQKIKAIHIILVILIIKTIHKIQENLLSMKIIF